MFFYNALILDIFAMDDRKISFVEAFDICRQKKLQISNIFIKIVLDVFCTCPYNFLVLISINKNTYIRMENLWERLV